MASRSKRVLLTGADGFTGRYLVPALVEAGWETYGLSLSGISSQRNIVADLLDTASLDHAIRQIRPDAVIHLAGISFVGHAESLDFYRVNMFGTLNLMAAIQGAGLSLHKIIIASSANVYGNPGTECIEEGCCPAPVNHYAMSKLAMEHMVRSHFEQVPVLFTRPFNYTGVGQDKSFLVPKIVDHFHRGEHCIELGNLEIARDFLDVRDVATAYVRLLESDTSAGIVNLCSGEAVSLKQMMGMFERITGRSMEIRVNKKWVRENEIRRLSGDNSKLLKLGWEKKIPLENTLRWMLIDE
jgi:nucleoside-diphosphate-sugar epimerase